MKQISAFNENELVIIPRYFAAKQTRFSGE